MKKLAKLKKLPASASSQIKIVNNATKASKGKVSNILRPKTVTKGNDGKKHHAQFIQLQKEIEKNKQLLKLTQWATAFFDDEPDIKKIAQKVSAMVDYSIDAVNTREFILYLLKNKSLLKTLRQFEHSPKFSINFNLYKKYLPYISFGVSKKNNDWSYRSLILTQAKTYKKQANTDWAITYRMPMILAAANIAAKTESGRCEEHAYTSLYLLNMGHMIQNMPYGQLKNDIFYTGAAIKGHAFALLVKGKEFKKAIEDAITFEGKSDIDTILSWLAKNNKKWGKNAWIIDGWNTKNVSSLASRKTNLPLKTKISSKMFSRDFGQKNQNFSKSVMAVVNAVKTHSSNSSKWDLTLKQMIYRVAKKYRITIK